MAIDEATRKAKVRAKSAARRAAMTEADRAAKKIYNAQYYKANASRQKLQMAAWYLANRDAVLEQHREYRSRPEVNASRKAKQRAYSITNRERIYSRRSARLAESPRLELTYRLSVYSLTLDRFDAMVIGQSGLCWICRRQLRGKLLHIDHDRQCCARDGSCGKCVRGLLCGNCNAMLGMAKESRETLTRAIEYLNQSNTPIG